MFATIAPPIVQADLLFAHDFEKWALGVLRLFPGALGPNSEATRKVGAVSSQLVQSVILSRGLNSTGVCDDSLSPLIKVPDSDTSMSHKKRLCISAATNSI